MAGPPLIHTVSLTRNYRTGDTRIPALRGVDLAVRRGEFVAVTGPSGSGKSTLMNLLGFLDRPTAGHYRFDGADVDGLDADARARLRNRSIGFVFQSFNLLARATALENVELPLVYAGVGRKERRRRAAAALERVGLGHRHHRPRELSGGEQQRVAIARALVNDPLLVLADEPTGALDSRTGLAIIALFQELNRAAGRTVLLVTHDPAVARRARRIVSMRDGSIVGDEPVPAPLDAVEGAAA